MYTLTVPLPYAILSEIALHVDKLSDEGKWSYTTWAGGFSFGGPPTVILNDSNEYGEPTIIARPYTKENAEIDAEFIAQSPNIIRCLLSTIAYMSVEIETLKQNMKEL